MLKPERDGAAQPAFSQVAEVAVGGAAVGVGRADQLHLVVVVAGTHEGDRVGEIDHPGRGRCSALAM